MNAQQLIPDTELPFNVGLNERRLREAYKKASVKRLLRMGVWVYIIMLLSEGGMRKWGLPALAAPLLIIRDPVAVWMLFMAWRNDMFPSNNYVWAMIFTAILGFFIAISIGHGSMSVAIYGTRILVIHFPLMFLIGNLFDKEDVIKFGKVMLWISLPMLLLIAVQFYSPQTAYINRGVGGDISGGGFAGALGFFRPPGTFSFTSGNTQFWSVVALFVVYFWLNHSGVSRILLTAASICVIASIPLSISRTLIFQIVLTVAFAFVSVSRNPKYIGQMLLAITGIVIGVMLLNNFEFFQQSTEALVSRYTDASVAEGGLEGTFGNRFFGGLLNALQQTGQPFFGYGIGMGTNVGAKLLTGDVNNFLIAEEEWGRLVGEMGTVMGIIVILIRVTFCVKAAWLSFKKLGQKEILPWIILSMAFVFIAQSQWAQPTTLGFSTLIGGLLIASLKTAIPAHETDRL
ncbi:hypothetical protein [Mucilaginibacter glaciei]|uniref:Uncharacterized protein n=1 Tax=Mucilaginibacter glaciei TaxID=2772109 RepID=A0A926S1Q1_9SPHI|nr:hypothetical protein [Mucilaginibacter glaciei]MBD1393308.1 hypothetical protein [Mucilaginibacter glaciei]